MSGRHSPAPDEAGGGQGTDRGPATAAPRLRRALRTLDALVRGEPPARPARTSRPRRAVRARLEQVEVSAGGVAWRTRLRTGSLPAAEVDRVVIAEVGYPSDTGQTIVRYALVVDHDDAVRVRVSAGRAGGPRGVRAAHRLRDAWAALDVPVRTEYPGDGRAADFYRRWPEAFSVVASYPRTIVIAVLGLWILVASVLERLLGS